MNVQRAGERPLLQQHLLQVTLPRSRPPTRQQRALFLRPRVQRVQ